MNTYMIPANSKRSMLIFGLFMPIDLIIVGVGAGLSGILFLIINAQGLKDIFTILSPALFTVFMVIPIPNHRNVWNFTANVYNYFSKRRTYYWKGWCISHGEEENTK